MAELVTVRGSGNDRRVVFTEAHPDHPHGDVMVANDGYPIELASTPAVLRALETGILIRVDTTEEPPLSPSPEGQATEETPTTPPDNGEGGPSSEEITAAPEDTEEEERPLRRRRTSEAT